MGKQSCNEIVVLMRHHTNHDYQKQCNEGSWKLSSERHMIILNLYINCSFLNYGKTILQWNNFIDTILDKSWLSEARQPGFLKKFLQKDVW
jgi:hypothetical protein